MLEFIRDGGFLMWPLLIGGALTVAAAARRALTRGEGLIDPDRMAKSLFALSIAYWGICMAKVCHVPFENPPQIYMLGFGETLSPVVVGLATYAIVGIIGALGRPHTASASASAPGPV
jgi:hypothetical protein